MRAWKPKQDVKIVETTRATRLQMVEFGFYRYNGKAFIAIDA